MKFLPWLLLLFPFPAFAQLAFPVLHNNDIIVFQGDSITDGGRQRQGNDYNHTMGQDYAYIIAALLGAQYPERNLTFINRGNSGNKVTDLAGRWQGDALNLKPNLLSILVGVNDTFFGNVPPAEYETVYDKLLADTVAALPGVKIVLCESFILPVGGRKEHYEADRAALKAKQEIVAKLAVKYHLPLVHFQQAFDAVSKKTPAEHWSWDGVHPTYAGHGLMAQEWMKVVNTMR